MLPGFGQLPDSLSLHGCSCVGLVLLAPPLLPEARDLPTGFVIVGGKPITLFLLVWNKWRSPIALF